MFYDLKYFPKIERGLLKVLHGALVAAKWYKMCGCMYLDGSLLSIMNVRVMKCVFIGSPESVKAYKLC